MTTLLITGAGGFLGSHVFEAALRTTSWHVICVDSFRHNGATDRITDVMADTIDGQILNDTRSRVTVVTHDLAVPFTTRQLDALGVVDYVVHAAARCSVDDSIADPVGHVNNNVQSTLTMLELARVIEPTRFLHVSTDEVYGTASAPNVHAPSSPYSASKAACEDLCHAYRETFDVSVSILNSANLFGERQSALAFIPRAIRLILAGETVPIHARAGWIGSRWYTYAPNVARHVVDRLAGDSWRWRYPLHGQEEWNVLDLAKHLAVLLDRQLSYELVEADETRPGWDQQYGELPYDSAWQPSTPASVGLKRTVEWSLAHLGWLT